jgi:hypothetical protein
LSSAEIGLGIVLINMSQMKYLSRTAYSVSHLRLSPIS